MLRSTLELLCCPHVRKGTPCRGSVECVEGDGSVEIEYGTLQCRKCRETFPVVAGVAILVRRVEDYFLQHVKGISKSVPDERIPVSFRNEFREHRDDILKNMDIEHIEEDLESDRVNALYLMTHYLTVGATHASSGGPLIEKWWKASDGSDVESESPVITEWVEKYWDHGPLSKVSAWITKGSSLVELGCGVGGLLHRISGKASEYLGVDSSFQSIRIARELNLCPNPSIESEFRIPGDLFHGNLSRPLGVPSRNIPKEAGLRADFVVGELEYLPVPDGRFDGSVCLNAIDMLDEPKILPESQARITRPDGFAIQCAPYIWHERVARGLRGRTPKGIQNSLRAVEWLYQKSGFEIMQSEAHIPWLFFKHLRQIELYSVHGFLAKKA